MLVDINKIKVSDRIRKDFGDIEDLARDIGANGLINPVVITPDGELIAGERRLRAHVYLGKTEIEVREMTVTDYEHQLRIEISENEHRKEFTFSERVEWGRRLEQVEKMKAKDRMAAGKENLPDQPAGQVRDIVAEQVGFGSGKQFDKAKYIADNATSEIIQQLDDGLISTHRAFIDTKERLEAAAREAEERAREAEAEAADLKRKFKDVVPVDQVDEAVAAAVERHHEENAALVRQREKEAEAQLKEREKYWKTKLEETVDNEKQKADQLRVGYQKVKEELEALRLQQPGDFDTQQAELQLKKLRFEADTNTIQFSLHVKQFLQKAGITSFNLGAIANASSSEKKRLSESLDMLQTFVDQLRPAVAGRKVVGKDVTS